jgi:hypothetical protein
VVNPTPFWALLFCLGCGAQTPSAADVSLWVETATFEAGALSSLADAGGPAVIDTYSRTSWANPGQRGKILTGTLASGSVALLLGLEGDDGHWILPASSPNTWAPDQPTFSALLGFARDLAPGDAHLRLVATDAQLRPGPATLIPITVLTAPPAEGQLVVVMSWDNDADLDLHVLDPLGNEVWKGDIATDPAGDASAGLLDFDSNANCTIDGRRLESVAWSQAPAGHYLVRVDAFSLCSASAAHWRVDVLVDGVSRLSAQGIATAVAARFDKKRGAGTLALEFDWAGGT